MNVSVHARALASLATAGLLVAVAPTIARPAIARATTAPATQPAATRPIEDHLPALVTYLTGEFSSAEQSKADPDNYFDIHLACAQVWQDRNDGPWLYIEQARGDKLGAPYRQRIYHLGVEPDGTYASAVYELPGPSMLDVVRDYAGAYKDQAKLAKLTPQQLSKKDGCTVYLTFKDGNFDGGTRGNGCPSKLAGASYANSQVHAEPAELRTWDRGYDEKGQQVWGAEKGPYHFKRVK